MVIVLAHFTIQKSETYIFENQRVSFLEISANTTILALCVTLFDILQTFKHP